MADDGAFLDSLMESSLYSLGAAFQDDHPELVDAVIGQAEAIERSGLETWAAAQEVPLESAFQTLVTGLALRYYRALSG
ncbi:MAG: hypothetical protein QOE86_4223 [Solirubrobacteraceae bacterium]|nr:hypothetical protein [Solirubrobacteraceae bacterium]